MLAREGLSNMHTILAEILTIPWERSPNILTTQDVWCDTVEYKVLRFISFCEYLNTRIFGMLGMFQVDASGCSPSAPKSTYNADNINHLWQRIETDIISGIFKGLTVLWFISFCEYSNTRIVWYVGMFQVDNQPMALILNNANNF